MENNTILKEKLTTGTNFNQQIELPLGLIYLELIHFNNLILFIKFSNGE